MGRGWGRDLGEEAVDGVEMSLPGGGGEGGESFELGAAQGAVGTGIVGNGGEPARAVEWLEVVGDGAGEFAEDGEVAGDDGDGVGEGFRNGKAEAFGKGGKQKGLRVVEKGGHVPVRTAVDFVDAAGEGGAALEEVDAVFAFPTALSDQDKVRGVGVAGFEGELAPELEEERVVFTRFNRTDHHEIGVLKGPSSVGRGEGVGGEKRVDGRGKRDALAVGEVLEAEEGLVGVGDDAGGEGEGPEHALGVDAVLFGAAVLGMGDGDEVVDEADEAEAAPSEGAEVGGAVEVGVAQIEEEGVAEVLGKPGGRAPAQDEGEEAEAGAFGRVEDEVEEASGNGLWKDPETVLKKDGGASGVAKVADVGEADPVDPGVQPAPQGAVEEAGDVDEEVGHGSRRRPGFWERGGYWLPRTAVVVTPLMMG